jgi:hypothetical protein
MIFANYLYEACFEIVNIIFPMSSCTDDGGRRVRIAMELEEIFYSIEASTKQ